jgi:ferritin-like metal-binding protein YciE
MTHYAELIGTQDAAQGLEENLKDSKGGDEKFTAIGDQKVKPQARAA